MVDGVRDGCCEVGLAVGGTDGVPVGWSDVGGSVGVVDGVPEGVRVGVTEGYLVGIGVCLQMIGHV